MAAPTSLETMPFINQQTGGVYLDNGAITSDGLGNISAGTLATIQQTGVVTTLTNGATIPTTLGVNRVTAGAAVTGLILAPGTRPGQQTTVIHEGASANTLTFAAAATSNVADGTSDAITGPSARTFVWDSVTSFWYAVH